MSSRHEIYTTFTTWIVAPLITGSDIPAASCLYPLTLTKLTKPPAVAQKCGSAFWRWGGCQKSLHQHHIAQRTKSLVTPPCT